MSAALAPLPLRAAPVADAGPDDLALHLAAVGISVKLFKLKCRLDRAHII